jgi:hypothetical protein
MPPKDRDPSWIPRRLDELGKQQDSDRAAILKTILPMIQRLQDQQDQLEELLTQVVKPGAAGLSASGWAVGTSSEAKVSATITVPPGGYVTALVMCVGQVSVYNDATAPTYVYANCGIAEDLGYGAGAESDTLAGATTGITLTPAAIQTVDVQGRSSFTITARARAGAVISESGSNVATVNAIAIFLKTAP